MTGRVEADERTLLPVAVSAGGPQTSVEAWIDTTFNGGLTLRPDRPRGEPRLSQPRRDDDDDDHHVIIDGVQMGIIAVADILP